MGCISACAQQLDSVRLKPCTPMDHRSPWWCFCRSRSRGSRLTARCGCGRAEDLLAKTEANKALNDKKRLATSGANFERSRTVTDGICAFPNNLVRNPLPSLCVSLCKRRLSAAWAR
jgi:hypothetical protein